MTNTTDDKNEYVHVDPFILNELQRDFRIKKPKTESLPKQFSDFVRWRNANPHVLEIEEWLRSIIGINEGCSMSSILRILVKFSKADAETVGKVIMNLIHNDSFVDVDVRYRSDSDLDMDKTRIYLKPRQGSGRIRNTCYG